MMFNFENHDFFDNHTHLLFQDKLSVTSDEFAINYYHGVRDEVFAEGKSRPSATAVAHLPYQGVIITLVNRMSQRFEIEPSLDSIVAFRNERTQTPEALREYTKMLYDDQNVVGCMLDSEYPMGDPKTKCFPCDVYRLFQYENMFFKLLETENTFSDILTRMHEAVSTAAGEGFAGLKGHIGEKCGMDVYDVSDSEAEAVFTSAKKRDRPAVRTVYYAMFSHLLEWCKDLDLPIHLHTGTTGFKARTDVYSLDPILMAPYLKNPRFLKTKIFLLHGSFPFSRNAAVMAANFPNVYLDLSQTLPWQSMLFERILEDALSITPHDKIVLGTGQHWYTEMVWLASSVAKSALANVLENLVVQNMLSRTQAERSAAMLLSENALRVYRKQ